MHARFGLQRPVVIAGVALAFYRILFRHHHRVAGFEGDICGTVCVVIGVGVRCVGNAQLRECIEKLLLMHSLPCMWLLLDSCSTADIFASRSLLRDVHQASQRTH